VETRTSSDPAREILFISKILSYLPGLPGGWQVDLDSPIARNVVNSYANEHRQITQITRIEILGTGKEPNIKVIPIGS
jgi:hypothetical protein